MLATGEKDHDGMKADGIMGLNNGRNSSNILDLGHSSDQLVSNMFAFKMGNENYGQKSYFYYNFTLEEEPFKDADFVNATRTFYWNIPMPYIMFGG